MAIIIEKDIEMPRLNHLGLRDEWQFMTVMEIGDSAFIPDGYAGCKKTAYLWRQQSLIARHYPELKFTGRKCEGGVRIWRTE